MAEHNVKFELFYDGAWNQVPVLTRDAARYMRGTRTIGNDIDPADATLTIDNASGLYSPRSVASALNGKIGQNTPGRLTVDGSVRMRGEVASWKPKRPVKGSAYTEIELAGVLRRIGRGTDPLRSPLYRSISSLGPVAYWPMEEGRDANEFGSAVKGKPPLVVTGVTFAANDSLGGSLALPQLAAGGTAVATLTAADYAAGTWEVEWIFYMPALPAADTIFMAIDTPGGAVVRWEFYFGASFANVYGGRGYGPDGSVVHSWLVTAAIPLYGQWLRARFSAKQNGANTDVTYIYLPADTYGGTGGVHTGSYAGAPGAPIAMGVPSQAGNDGMRIGHWASFTTYNIASSDGASAGWAGETAGVRFQRLCGEEGITASFVGDPNDTAVMGPQGTDTLLDLLDEIARTDDASIFETRNGPGLTMRTGASKQNQNPALTVSYLGQIQPPLLPVFGDEGIRNDVTARNPDGTTRRVVQETGPRNVQAPGTDPQGVGRYQTSLDVNTLTSAQLTDAAGWRINLGTFDGTWYATVTVDLDAAPGLTAAVNAVDIGDIVAISELPVDEALDVVKGIVIGISEDLPPKRRLVTFYLVPAEPYQVGILANTTGDTDPVVGRAESDGATVTSAVAGGAATFQVSTPSGPLWTTVADDFPLDIVVGGQRVTISNITGSSSPQTFTVSTTPGAYRVRYPIPANALVEVFQPLITVL